METHSAPDEVKNDCLIIGASVRAAAESAVRAGFRVAAADLFSDRDTQSIARCVRVRDYPQGLLSVREQHAELPVVYTGALENYPSIVDDVQRLGPLWGNDAAVLRRVRDPADLAAVLNENGLPFPKISTDLKVASDTWLRKSIRSAGGQHVEYATANQRLDHGCYFQEYLEGAVCSASYVASGGVAEMIGVTDMLVGQKWLGASGFIYCGSILRDADPDELRQWRMLGQVLAREFQLIGVFGVDAIVRQRQVIPIEVNPRLTASMEVLEDAGIVSVFTAHVNACNGEPFAVVNAPTCITGKAILYAAASTVVPRQLPSPVAKEVRLADLPARGESIHAGQPILTILAEDDTQAGVLRKLKDTANKSGIVSLARPSSFDTPQRGL